MKIQPALIVTILNEAENIELLLSSIVSQHLRPTEVVIVDGGSTDQTVEIIKNYLLLGNNHRPETKDDLWQVVNSGITFKIKVKPGNRSVGRNEAACLADNEWLAITDAGCILTKNWLRELARAGKTADVVAGYYQADPLNPFEEAMVPFVLVMPDKVKPEIFLPATRSMLIKKEVLLATGGFDEALSDNEDYALARKLQKSGANLTFAPKALAIWIPRQTWRQFASMIFRFARGDAFAGLFRPKVVTIFGRYLVWAWVWSVDFRLALSTAFIYLYWAYAKNRRYTPHGWYYLPLLQVVADGAVMTGTVVGLWRRLKSVSLRRTSNQPGRGK